MKVPSKVVFKEGELTNTPGHHRVHLLVAGL